MTMMPYFFPGKVEEIYIEKGSDNMSFVKSESMELKRSMDNNTLVPGEGTLRLIWSLSVIEGMIQGF